MTGSGLEHTGQWLPRRPVTSESLLSRSAAGWMRTRPASSKLFHPAKSSCESPRRCCSPDQSLCAIITRLHFSTSFKGPGTRPIATPATPCFSPHTFPLSPRSSATESLAIFLGHQTDRCANDMQRFSVPTSQFKMGSEDIHEREKEIVASVRPPHQRRLSPFVIAGRAEEKQLGISTRRLNVNDFALLKTLGTGKLSFVACAT